jgi:signal transduction histidine kinase
VDLPPRARSYQLNNLFGSGTGHSTERSLALARVWIGLGGLTLVCPDLLAAHPLRNSSLRFAIGFTVYSLLILFLFKVLREFPPLICLGIHCADTVWVIVWALFARESHALFLLLFFVLAAAARRWGPRGVLETGGAVVVLVISESLLLGSSTPGTKMADLLRSNGADYVSLAAFAMFATGLLRLLAKMEREQQWEVSARGAQQARARIGMELHDSAIQALYTLDCHLERLRCSSLTSPASIARDLAKAQKLLHRSTVELRAIVRQGLPLDLGSKSFSDYVTDLIDEFQRETGIAVRFVSDCDRISPTPAVGNELVRIIQEALVNIRKHSGARNVMIRFSSVKGCWRFLIDDDGRGFDFSGRLCMLELEATRQGPVIIRERVSTLGGELVVESTPGHGARLDIALPKEASG